MVAACVEASLIGQGAILILLCDALSGKLLIVGRTRTTESIIALQHLNTAFLLLHLTTILPVLAKHLLFICLMPLLLLNPA